MKKLIEWPYYRPEFLKAQGFSPTIVKRFWAKVRITDGCWEWIASRHGWGYGRIGRWKEGDSAISGHVLSWILHFGAIPKGLCVLHRCDNPPCVNPRHLWLGTIRDNTHDMISKGRDRFGFRLNPPFGETNGNRKLSYAQVLEIRRLYKNFHFSQQEIADAFHVSQTLISAVVRLEIWTHVQTRPL